MLDHHASRRSVLRGLVVAPVAMTGGSAAAYVISRNPAVDPAMRAIEKARKARSICEAADAEHDKAEATLWNEVGSTPKLTIDGETFKSSADVEGHIHAKLAPLKIRNTMAALGYGAAPSDPEVDALQAYTDDLRKAFAAVQARYDEADKRIGRTAARAACQAASDILADAEAEVFATAPTTAEGAHALLTWIAEIADDGISLDSFDDFSEALRNAAAFLTGGSANV